MSNGGETWREVPGYGRDGLTYEVSSLGRIRSVRILAVLTNDHGYAFINSQPKRLKIHRAVASAFHSDEHFEGALVRHLDGNPANNRADNLKWGTAEENAQDSLRHGTNHMARRTHCKQNHEYTTANTRIDRGRRVCRACALERSKRENAEFAKAKESSPLNGWRDIPRKERPSLDDWKRRSL